MDHKLRQSIALVATASLLVLAGLTGCQTQNAAVPTALESQAAEAQTIREGDVLKISFPGTQSLDSQQTVRRDGRITLPMVGEVRASGKTPSDLEKELLGLYASQLVSKEVSVTVVQSTFVVFVSGSVMRPGKLISDHPMTALEAVMEAGGFTSSKADSKNVVVIRNESGKTKNYSIDLKQILEGRSNEPFYLKPNDIIYVPERFTWF